MVKLHPTHTLIVGGTRGIGRALVRTLLDEHHTVSVIGRRPASEADRRLSSVSYWLVNLANHEQLSAALGEIVQKNGKLNNLIFVQRYRGEGNDWTGEIDITLTATKFVIDRVVGEFSETDENAIVIVSSVASHFIVSEQPVSYHIAKASLDQMVRYYAVVLGPRGIRVNGVAPGTVLKDESKDFYLKNEEVLKVYKGITPLGRMGTSTDVTQVIAFLCSHNASFVTGQTIVVDGGVSLQGHESLARQLTSLSHLSVTRSARENPR